MGAGRAVGSMAHSEAGPAALDFSRPSRKVWNGRTSVATVGYRILQTSAVARRIAVSLRDPHPFPPDAAVCISRLTRIIHEASYCGLASGSLTHVLGPGLPSSVYLRHEVTGFTGLLQICSKTSCSHPAGVSQLTPSSDLAFAKTWSKPSRLSLWRAL
jgi:hypothetical protein